MPIVAQLTETFEQLTCGGCGIHFYVPEHWLKKKRNEEAGFHCPNGCSRVFVGENEADKLKRQLQQAQQELANKSVEKIQIERQLENLQKQLKRVQKGTCPCCKRSFSDLKRHMATKHPDVKS
jgi:DNA repair exonuclease SbcCD ATPase subunit